MLKDIKNIVKNLFRSEDGQGMVEYIIIVVVIAIAAIVVFRVIGARIRATAQKAADEIEKLGDTLAPR